MIGNIGLKKFYSLTAATNMSDKLLFTRLGATDSELSLNSNSNIAKQQVLYNDEAYTAGSIEDLKGQTSVFILSNVNASPYE